MARIDLDPQSAYYDCLDLKISVETATDELRLSYIAPAAPQTAAPTLNASNMTANDTNASTMPPSTLNNETVKKN